MARQHRHEEPTFHKSVLPNGVRIVTEHHPFMRSVASGIFVDLGTRDEPENLNGAAHFIEHLVFKRTKTRSAYAIAKALEAVGGDLNAYTSREQTCFHAMTLKQHLPLAIDVLVDLVSEATFDSDDFEKERQVIIQEIDMSADSFEEYVFDMYFELAYKSHDLGTPILGTRKSLNLMKRKVLFDYYKRFYRGYNLVVSVAGDVDHQKLVETVEGALGKSKALHRRPPRKKPKVKAFRKFLKRPSEQVHILLGHPSTAFTEKHRFEAYIVNAVLGGGMTSRLYQSVREKYGLVYSIYSFLHAFTDSGLLQIYAGASAKNAPKVLELIDKEYKKIHKNGIRRVEVEFFKTQVKGQILLGSDDMENRMNSLGINEMVFGDYKPVDQVIQEIDDVSVDSIQEYIEKYMKHEGRGALILGDLKETEGEKLLDLAMS